MQFLHKYVYIGAIIVMMVPCLRKRLTKVATIFGTDPLPAWIFYSKSEPEVFKLMDLLFTVYCFLQQP